MSVYWEVTWLALVELLQSEAVGLLRYFLAYTMLEVLVFRSLMVVRAALISLQNI